MGSIRQISILVFSAVFFMGAIAWGAPPVPTNFSYQGMVVDSGVAFTGDADFKFALVDSVSDTYFWSNDGTLGYPSASVTVPVQAGLFTVLVGSAPMANIDPAALVGFNANQALRVWINLTGSEVLLGDVPLSSVLFAHTANFASESSGPFTAAGQIHSTTGGFKFPDGTTQVTAATGGGGGGGTLDDAYDFGGPGAGQNIVADSGPVSVWGTGGLWIQDHLTIGFTAPLAPLQVGFNNWDLEATHGDFMIGDENYNLRFGVATGGGGAGSARLRAVGGINRLSLGAGTMDVVRIDTTGFQVLEGAFRVFDGGQVNMVSDFGSGQGGSAFRAENTNTSGIATWAEAHGSNATSVIVNDGTGPLIRGYHNGTLNFEVTNAGQVELVGDYGAGQAGSALRAENTDPSGIAVWAEVNSNDAAIVIGQDGTGDMVRGFDNGSLKFRVLDTGEVITPSITITGGADLSEPFTMAEVLGQVEKGSVMVIDPDNPGSLTLSGQPYDPRVAGIVSGAGGVNPGLTLSQQGVIEGGQQVALSGRVYVRVSAENGPIVPGDMITTSTKPGVGMRATDREKSYGAVVGKAMTGLDEGEGLVLVLVGLQ